MTRKFDLEERTFEFAKKLAEFCRKLDKTNINTVYINQVIRSSSSVGANYIEANEGLSKKDFILRVKICRKEAKETSYWLRLIKAANNRLIDNEIDKLICEVNELKKIFSSIVEKMKDGASFSH